MKIRLVTEVVPSVKLELRIGRITFAVGAEARAISNEAVPPDSLVTRPVRGETVKSITVGATIGLTVNDTSRLVVPRALPHAIE